MNQTTYARPATSTPTAEVTRILDAMFRNSRARRAAGSESRYARAAIRPGEELHAPSAQVDEVLSLRRSLRSLAA